MSEPNNTAISNVLFKNANLARSSFHSSRDHSCKLNNRIALHNAQNVSHANSRLYPSYICKFVGTKGRFNIKENNSTSRGLVCTPTWPLFHGFGTPICLSRRHVKTLYKFVNPTTLEILFYVVNNSILGCLRKANKALIWAIHNLPLIVQYLSRISNFCDISLVAVFPDLETCCKMKEYT